MFARTTLKSSPAGIKRGTVTGGPRWSLLPIEEHADDAEPHQDDGHRVGADPLRPQEVPRAVGESPDQVEQDSREEREGVEPERDRPGEGHLGHVASKGPPSKNLSRHAFGGLRRRSGAIVRASRPRVRAHHASTLGYDPGFSSTQKRNAKTRKSAARPISRKNGQRGIGSFTPKAESGRRASTPSTVRFTVPRHAGGVHGFVAFALVARFHCASVKNPREAIRNGVIVPLTLPAKSTENRTK